MRYFLPMKSRTKLFLVLGVFALPLLVMWGDLLLNALGGAGYLKLGMWWF